MSFNGEDESVEDKDYQKLLLEENDRLSKLQDNVEMLQLKPDIEKNEMDVQTQQFQRLKAILQRSHNYGSFLIQQIEKDESSEKSKRKRKAANSDESSTVKKSSRIMDKTEINSIVAQSQPSASKDFEDIKLQYFNGILRDYQIEGIHWLWDLFLHGINGILADEMGLGKTIQVIAHVARLLEASIRGPFLIIAPTSTLNNWVMEYKRFAPRLPVTLYYGNPGFRKSLLTGIKRNAATSVVTSYEIAMNDRQFLQKILWKYIVVDEGHRLKNLNCRLVRDLKSYQSANRLLLTGTPLQNNLRELWSLLNFLMSDIFDDLDTFECWLDHNRFIRDSSDKRSLSTINAQEEEMISILHQILDPFLLCRKKKDVLIDLPPKREILVRCPMTDVQKKYYKNISEKTILQCLNKALPFRDSTNDSDIWKYYGRSKSRQESKEMLLNMKMEESKSDPLKLTSLYTLLRKTCNHPFLIDHPKDSNEDFVIDEELVNVSGKMRVLDKLLKGLKQRNHRVLIFSQWVIIIDLLEYFCELRNYSFCRIDGMTNLEDRQIEIDKYQTTNVYIFLLSTRAGGLGINLTAADTVIIFDSDWNPQIDIQASARCHRIGQLRPVIIYRLLTENTVDSYIFEKASAKRAIEKLVIKDGRFTSRDRRCLNYSKGELAKILREQSEHLDVSSSGSDLADDVFEKLLNREFLFSEEVLAVKNNLNFEIFESTSEYL